MAQRFLPPGPVADKPVILLKLPGSRKRNAAVVDDCTEELDLAEEAASKKKAKVQGNTNPKSNLKSKEMKKSKPKSKTDIFEEDDEDGDCEPSQTITVHLFIESVISSAPPKSRAKSTSSTTKTLQRGPFFHDTVDGFDTLKRNLAKITPCAIESLIIAKLQWKFETPLGGFRKLLTNEVGYNAMISAVKGKKGDVAVFVYMPPPAKSDVVSDVFH